ncbi:MAG: NADP-dependent oxidoreductase [Rubrivivax sp.]|nr:NADP-dependent oxidoreductase [Rubrivivax sp.]
MQTHRQVILASRPEGIPQAQHFRIVEVPAPLPGPGQLRVRNRWLSVEPAMRGWVSAVANYAEPVPLGGVMRAFAAGHVDMSNHPDWPVGTPVTGLFGWQELAVVEPAQIQRRVDDGDLPLSTALGVMGINGVTAHYGLLEIGQPQPGDTVVVSTAAGAVGSVVGQIARIRGCRTVGIAGGEAKRQLCLQRFGYDVALDYKAPGFEPALQRACEGGVNVYFDNTAGAISDAVMAQLAVGARVVICGTASVASWQPAPLGPRVERHLLVKRARMQGFVIFDHPQHGDVARADLQRWIREGRLQYVEEVLDGLEQAPDAIAGLYRGENLGKRLIRL